MTAATFAVASLPGGLALLKRGERRPSAGVDSTPTTSESARGAEVLDV